MKFWKQALITTFCFFSVIATVLYSSCTKDSCANLNCYNGGYCNAGFCVCPNGFTGPACQTRPVTAFLGTYYGFISVDVLPSIRDTVEIWTKDSTNVLLVDHYDRYDTLYGTVSVTPSSNIINFPVDSNASRRIYYSGTVINKELNFYSITDDYITRHRTTNTFDGTKP